MNRNLSGWGVTAAGLLLACGGAYAMWTGWDMILVERGWSLFIAGSVALSGGVVTIALGRVVARLERLGAHGALAAPPREANAPKPDAARANALEAADAARPDLPFTRQLSQPVAEEPIEVDRYSAGDATYVMMSDGSVEVRTGAGAQRYPSLAALRAEAESRQR